MQVGESRRSALVHKCLWSSVSRLAFLFAIGAVGTDVRISTGSLLKSEGERGGGCRRDGGVINRTPDVAMTTMTSPAGSR